MVLTHRIATASPRRYLIADEVGLGKTIETGLILRELASRGEMNRALMVVPAGLVNNWHHELNEVFNLNFEVFGSESDITDRKSNAFAKHDLLIAGIDTLKRPARIKRLLEAPRWDLVVFDEAHHLTAYRNGNKVTKTANYKLSEALKNHARDLLLLSATPHQGNHFRFWMLIQILNPTLFNNVDEMLEHRHRLNSVIFRRTKADACKSDGSQLFARRWVHTESFLMGQYERHFYERLREYLQDGFDLARRQGNQGRALGKVDEQGHVAEDLRSQILGQLSERLNYDRLYQEAITDPELRRTRLELEAALSTASEARKVVSDLFQDLEGFNLDDYQPFSDVSSGMERLVYFLSAALIESKQHLPRAHDRIFEVFRNDGSMATRTCHW